MHPGELAVVIRPRAVIRVYVAVFMVVWLGLVFRTTMVRHHGGSVRFGIASVIFGLRVGPRGLWMGAPGYRRSPFIARSRAERQLATLPAWLDRGPR